MSRSIMIIVASVVLAVIGQALLKVGMDQVGRIGSLELAHPFSTVWRVASTPRVLAGLTFYVLSAGLYMVALSRVDLSVAYPIVGLSYVIVALIAQFILGESVTLMRWAGVAVITLGVIIVSRSV